jgi:hypothetical protein
MNERIRQLAEQAGISLSQKDFSYYWVESAEDMEKFAKLIVRECMACSTWVGKVNNYAIEPVHTAYTINQRMKEHFGVEE